MELIQLTKYYTLTEEEFDAIIEFKCVEIPFRVLKTTQISARGTCYTAVSIKLANTFEKSPNLTRGQKEKIREMIQNKLNKL